MQKICAIFFFCFLFILPPSLMADEPDPVLQTIDTALQQYKNNDFSNAANSLEYATQLIRQKKGDALSKLLPPPLENWKAEDAEATVTAASLFGGGLSAKRTYTKEDATVSITIVTDSPLMQSMMMMFSNPMFASAAGKFELINGHKGIINYKNGGGDINIIVNNRFLVTLDGSNVSREELLNYAKTIDLKSIAALP